MRLPLMLLGLAVAWLTLTAMGSSEAWPTAIGLTNLLFTLFVDGTCLALLVWRGRVEGFSLGSLLGIDRKHVLKDILLGIGLFILLAVVFQISTLLSLLAVYGPAIFARASAQAQTGTLMPPLWVFWWSATIFPVGVGLIEELTYRGYALPRLESVSGKWAALLVVSAGFAMQHIALPLVDWQTSLSRVLATLPIGFVTSLVYFKQRRLLPLVIAHWAIDFIFLGLLPLIYMLNR